MSCRLGKSLHVVLGLIATRQFRNIAFSASARAWSKTVNFNAAQHHHFTHLVITRNELHDCMDRSLTCVRFHVCRLLKQSVGRRLGCCPFLVYFHLLEDLSRDGVMIFGYVSFFAALFINVIMLTNVHSTAEFPPTKNAFFSFSCAPGSPILDLIFALMVC